jgi:hypothetical protein
MSEPANERTASSGERYCCGWCGQPTTKSGAPIPGAPAYGGAVAVNGECCRHLAYADHARRSA